MSNRKQYKAEFESKVALEALKGEQASGFGVHPTKIHQWKKALLEGALELFERYSSAKEPVVSEAKVKALYTKTGELTVANGAGKFFEPTALDQPINIPRNATRRERRQPFDHGRDRPTVSRHAVLWCPSNVSIV
ncbi:MAG: transposase [Geminicoccaceae bacterium]